MHNMRRGLLVLMAGAPLLATIIPAQGQDDPYRQKMSVRSFDIKAAVPTTSPLANRLRGAGPDAPAVRSNPPAADAGKLAAEVQVIVRGYVPRAVDPVLVVDGGMRGTLTGIEVINAEGDSRLTFTVLNAADVLRQGSELAIQVGDQEETRTRISEGVKLENVKPLDAGTARRHNLPRSLR